MRAMQPLDWVDDEQLLWLALAGSRAYGLNTPESDVDTRGVFVAPRWTWDGLTQVPDVLDSNHFKDVHAAKDDVTYWEVGHFIKRLLQANPNMLEVLYAPIRITNSYDRFDGVRRSLWENRWRFLSKRLVQSYGGYARAQHRSMFRGIDKPLDLKHAMHCIRLLRCAEVALRTGELPVNIIDPYLRTELLSIRNGEWREDAYEDHYITCYLAFEAAAESSTLPDEPDADWADEFLQTVRACAS